MSKPFTNEVLRLAALQKTDLERVVLAVDDMQESPGFQAYDEADQDNDAMLQSGVSMTAGGDVAHGSVPLGHVQPHTTPGNFEGTHVTGVKTGPKPTRGKAALALLALHKNMKKRVF